MRPPADRAHAHLGRIIPVAGTAAQPLAPGGRAGPRRPGRRSAAWPIPVGRL